MLFNLIVLAVVGNVAAWSSRGHRMVAKEASKMLTDTAIGFLSAHLHADMLDISPSLTSVDRIGEGMAAVSSWADGLVPLRPYHYTHTEFRDCKPLDRKRDCPHGRCLPTGIERFMKEASDVHASGQMRAEAIKFLIHLVADATQPFHTGFADDVGGLFISVASPAATSLHRFWDSNIVAYALENGLSLHRPTGKIPDEFLKPETVGEWIVSETIEKITCSKAYVDDRGDWIKSGASLGLEYLDDRAAVAMNQLSKASVYLAQILNLVAKVFTDSRKKQMQLRSGNNPVAQSANRFDVLEAQEPIGNEVEAPEVPIRATSTRKPKRPVSVYKGVDLKGTGVSVRGDKILVTSRSMLEANPDYNPTSKRISSATCVFKDRPMEIYRVEIDLESLPSVAVTAELSEALFMYHLGWKPELYLSYGFWSQLSARSQSRGIKVSEVKQSDDVELQVIPTDNVIPSNLRFVTGSIRDDILVALIDSDDSDRQTYRFNCYISNDESRKAPLLILIESREGQEADVKDPREFLRTLAQSNEELVDKSSQILTANVSLRRTLYMIYNLYALESDPGPKPASFKELRRIDRSRDKPWLETIELEIDSKADRIDFTQLITTDLHDGSWLVTTHQFIAEDATASRLIFHRVPLRTVHNDVYLDWRMIDDRSWEGFDKLTNAQRMKSYVKLTNLKGGRAARAIRELDGMLSGKGGKRLYADKYKRMFNNQILMVRLFDIDK